MNGDGKKIRKAVDAVDPMPFPSEEQPPDPTPVVEVPTPKVEEWPKAYRCVVKCWVASKVEVFTPGDVVLFYKGEYVPSHFELVV
jgi:hypothetical protein